MEDKKPYMELPAQPKHDNQKNLWIYHQTAEEHAEAMRRSRPKAAETRRRHRLMRELAEAMLDSELKRHDPHYDELVEKGLPTIESTSILFAQLCKAKDGDTESARFLRDTSGQKPGDSLSVSMEEKPFDTIDLTKLSDEELNAMIAARENCEE